ncbi:MAG: nodulation protein NfeD [Thermoleophilia bacterium]
MRLLGLVALALLALLVPAAGSVAAGDAPRVLAVEFENDVNPVTAGYLIGQIERANDDGYDAVAILLDTPGGLSESMRDITKAELASRIPVIVYVWPDGARAASAGVWIGQAADVLAMAPQTNLGSSTPVMAGGGDIPQDLRRKAVNDAAKSLRALAEEHGRNGDWAEQAVRKASNLTAREALERNVIDVVAPDLPTLLDEIDGTRAPSRDLVLHTAGAEVATVEMSLWKRILDVLIDPNIVTLLLSLGVLGITVELLHPGLIFPAAFGGISLVTGLYGLHVLPVSWAGIALLLLALGFFAAEVVVTSHGALALAGAASFAVGALMLFDPAGPGYQVSLPVAITVAVVLAALLALVGRKALLARRMRPATGAEELAGEAGVVRQRLAPEGLVFVHGELWRARLEHGAALDEGEPVSVVRLDEELVLVVRPVGEASSAGPSGPRQPAPTPTEGAPSVR